jgi:N-acetylglucosaminyldiphosphoundecaprenol N-acetyl-beta-D-mannosaminyltransferase
MSVIARTHQPHGGVAFSDGEPPPDRTNILGVGVSAIDMSMAVRQIRKWIATRARTYVCVTGVHGIMESQRNPRLRDVHNAAGMVTPDGMPLVYISRACGRRTTTRVYGPDLMAAVCSDSVAAGYTHFLYGATNATLIRLAEGLRRRFPGIRIVGSHAPPFRPLTNQERTAVIASINRCQPDVIWVGLSTPKQETWMAEMRADLDAPVLIGVGAAFDFYAGTVKQAPRWMQPLCLEWFYRLLVEPRRLWRRYLLNNPAFLAALFMQATGLKHYRLEGPPPAASMATSKGDTR